MLGAVLKVKKCNFVPSITESLGFVVLLPHSIHLCADSNSLLFVCLLYVLFYFIFLERRVFREFRGSRMSSYTGKEMHCVTRVSADPASWNADYQSPVCENCVTCDGATRRPVSYCSRESCRLFSGRSIS